MRASMQNYYEEWMGGAFSGTWLLGFESAETGVIRDTRVYNLASDRQMRTHRIHPAQHPFVP